MPPAGFSWSHSLANITLEQPWESLFFIDRKVRVRARRVLRPPLQGRSSLSQLLLYRPQASPLFAADA